MSRKEELKMELVQRLQEVAMNLDHKKINEVDMLLIEFFSKKINEIAESEVNNE